ncbi:MAG TPA: GNAT family N-acetyltransferase [Candidatus Krumholzibacteria bacterium]|nr:GNAT family N-acetyltransferase [Candidatus Krumholzibacteria bacterium]
MRPFHGLILQTERLRLRPFEPRDAAALFGIFSDPVVMRYWSSPAWTSPDEATAYITSESDAMRAEIQISLAITLRATDEVIGTCTLFDFMEQCRRAEVGYSLASAAWGKRYMHEALTALLDYGFVELDLNRVEADIDPRNARSARSLERLGFKREGLLRERWIVSGEISDTALYGLLRSEWSPRT